LEEAVKAEDGFVKATRLRAYVHSDVRPAQQFAMDELSRSGSSAVTTIRGMLNDNAFAGDAAPLVAAYAAAGGEALGEDLNARLREELKFWRSVAPSLPLGWWNPIGLPDREAFQRRYMLTLRLVQALQQLHYGPALPTARQLSDFWKSVPQLEDRSGLSQLSQESDKLIEQLSH
jgi:hypothetical protein